MQKKLRQKFNQNFTEEKYIDYVQRISNLYPEQLDFRLAETPIFVPKNFIKQMLDCCEEIIDVITDPKFKSLTDNAIPDNIKVPGENDHAHFIAFDFGVCETDGVLTPQLVEMQGFPTLFGFEAFHAAFTKTYADIPANYEAYLNGYTEETYIQLLKDIIVGDLDPKHVILLEIFPEEQKTRFDFSCTETLLGIKTVCFTKLTGEGDKLYYENKGEKVEVKRIYNRLIFDDLHQQKDLGSVIDITYPWQVEWITHPNWFYRISKYTLPLIRNSHVPKTYFLNEIKQLPEDLKNYVLKPLFSFAGMGVVIDIKQEDIDNIKDPENWILQQKVTYADVIETPEEPAKTEIRLFYFWKDEWARPKAALNLTRLSKGKMIGTRYNKDKTWVGGSLAFFEQ